MELRTLFSETHFVQDGVAVALSHSGVLRIDGSVAQSESLTVSFGSLESAIRATTKNPADVDSRLPSGVLPCKFHAWYIDIASDSGFGSGTITTDAVPDEYVPILSASFPLSEGDYLYAGSSNGLNIVVPMTAISRIIIECGDFEDTVDVGCFSNAIVEVHGGGGNDRITSMARKSRLYGDAGDDQLSAIRSTRPFLSGGSGNDRLIVRSDADGTVDGGSGKHDRSNALDALSIEQFIG